MENITLNEVLGKYFVYEENLCYEGKGEYGEAYSFDFEDKKYVIKFTSREIEFECASYLKELQDKVRNIDDSIYIHSAKIYELGTFLKSNKHHYNYYIIMEFIEMDEELSGMFQNYMTTNSDYTDEDNDEDKMYSEEEEESFRCMLKVQEIIGGSDLHANNLGYGLDGVIKGFDWDRNGK